MSSSQLSISDEHRDKNGIEVVSSDISSLSPPEAKSISYKAKKFDVTDKEAVDETLAFMLKYDATTPEMTDADEKKLTRKLYIVVAVIAWTNLVFFMDKYTMGFASTFGFFEAIGIDGGVNRYNTMNTLYYVGYILGQSNLYWAQKFGNRKAMITLCFLWNVIMFLTCTLTSYQGAYVLRFFLGFVESVAMTLANITLQQLFPASQKFRIGQIFMIAAQFAQLPISFIAYGLLKQKTPPSIPLWKVFVIIIGCLTTFTLFLIIWLYPTNPTDARFLTIEEKVWTIRRLQKTNGASIGTKRFKKYQAVEAIKDPVTWYYVGAMFSLMLCNNITYIENIIFTELGLTSVLNTYLVTAAGSGFYVVCGIFTFFAMKWWPRVWNNTFTIIFWVFICLVPCILMAALPWSVDKKVFLAMTLICSVFGCSWIGIVSAYQSSCAGYTKMLVRTGLSMAAYSIANIIASRIYYDSAAPRYYVAWGIQSGGFFFCIVFILLAYFTLSKRNVVRLAALELESEKDFGLVETEGGEEKAVNLANLDLTDLENERFIYPL
ncbi:hypothetical protein QEN19_000980 [Hanseniaspora menglaensis]